MAKLLFITQKVDRNDDVLGFIHGWLLRFAEHFQSITVLCLQKGEYSFPPNIRVFSMGKEKKKSRVSYVSNFYKYIWRERENYDAVLVHMNTIYVILGSLFWFLGGKKVGLWYNHPRGSAIARIAGAMVNRIFYTSPHSFFAQCGKARMMPAGIDTDLFKKDPSVSRPEHSILYLGRVSRIKRIDVLINAAKILNERQVDFKLRIVGSGDEGYRREIEDLSGDLLGGKIVFLAGVKNSEARSVFNANQIFVNATPSGSLDKTVLEAMACESLVIVSNKFFDKILPAQFSYKESDASDLADKLEGAFLLDERRATELGRQFREYVIKHHGLDELSGSLSDFYETS